MKNDGRRLGLYVVEQTDGDYFHIRANPIVVQPDGKVRNADHDYLISPLYLANFEVASQGNNGKRGQLYGWEIHYKPYCVEERDAARMLKTFRTVRTRLDKLRQKYGEPATYGQFVARVANAIGADCIVWRKGAKGNGAFGYDGDEHRVESVGDGAAHVDHMVARWQEAAAETPEIR